MRKKQWMAAVLVGLAVITEDGKKYYDFQDVKENNYRARLLEQVPRNSYDFSNLALDEETGYLSYKDTKGKVSAKKGIGVSLLILLSMDKINIGDCFFQDAL